MDEKLILDVDDLVDYVQDKLLTHGYAVSREALGLVFDYETDYMIEKGFAE